MNWKPHSFSRIVAFSPLDLVTEVINDEQRSNPKLVSHSFSATSVRQLPYKVPVSQK